MAFDAKTERLISLKKLSGKAHTSNNKGLPNEGLPSGITMSTATIFAEAISTSPTATPYQITGGTVEFLRLPVSFILGSDTSDGRHGFEVKLPSDYESNSSNPSAGSGVFVNNKVLNTSNGKLQLIPPSFAASYEAKPHYGSIGSGTRIFLLDARDWNLDYFNGVLFQQDPPGTGDHAQNPTYVEAYIYIGDYLDGSSGADGDITAVNAGNGLQGGASSGVATLAINNSVVATLTGSVFSGNVVAQTGLSGSLQQLANGTSYLREGSNISIASGSDGSITISASDSSTTSVGSVGLSTGPRKSEYTGASTTAGNNKTVSNSNFSSVDYDPSSIDVFLNGILLHSGSSANVSGNDADYYLTGASTLKFGFDIDSSDILDVVVSSESETKAAPYITFEAHNILSNERVLRVSEVLSLTTGTAGQIDLDIDRKKEILIMNSALSTGNPLSTGVDFSKVSYLEKRIDVYLNGAMLLSGSARDYTIQPTSNIVFNFDLFVDDSVIVSVI